MCIANSSTATKKSKKKKMYNRKAKEKKNGIILNSQLKSQKAVKDGRQKQKQRTKAIKRKHYGIWRDHRLNVHVPCKILP